MVGFAAPAAPRVCSLAARVLLLFWDDAAGDPPPKLTVSCAGTDVPAPVHRLSAPLEGGGARLFLAFAASPEAAGPIEVTGPDGALFSLDAPRAAAGPAGHGVLDPAALLSGLTDAGRVRILRFLLQGCRTAFGTGGDAHYAAGMRRLVEEVSLRPGLIEPRALLNRHHVLATAALPATLGDNAVALSICDDAVQESPLAPSVGPKGSAGNGHHSLYLTVGSAILDRDARIVVLGSAGIAIRRLAPSTTVLEPVAAWLAARGGTVAALRDYALECLTSLGGTDGVAADAAREVIALASPDGVAIMPDCAIAAGEHLFLGGTLSDPRDVVVAVELRVGDWTAVLDRGAIATFPREARDRAGSEAEPSAGFVALARGDGRLPVSGMARIALQLRSGAVVDAGAVPLLAGGEEAASRVLKAVPAGLVTDRIVGTIVAPALRALADAVAPGSAAAADILQIGTPSSGARASIVLPLHADLGLFTAWAAGLGGRVWDAGTAELVFVQPPLMPVADAERALVTLYRRFRLSSRLVCAAGEGQADSFNLGAQAAAGDRLVFLGGTCLPQSRGAIAVLIAALADNPGGGVVGGVVLDPSGAVRHAGFLPPEDGRLVRRHAGFPAPMLQREAAGPAFACSSAFLGVTRAAFESLGGFAAGYLTRDWADADFCLRARGAGHAVLFAPDARVVGYGNGCDPRKYATPLAERADAWRFLQDRGTDVNQWRDEAPAAEGCEAEQRWAVRSAAAVDPRWAA